MGTLRLGSSVVVPSVTVNSGSVQPVIDSLSITPTTSQQTITAPSGIDGYSPITVSAVNNTIDANIVAGNIKKDVSILGVTGTYEGSGGDFYGIRKSKGFVGINMYLSSVPELIDLSTIKGIDDYALAYAYYNTSFTTATSFSFPTITRISKGGMQGFNKQSEQFTQNNITDVGFPALTEVDKFGLAEFLSGVDHNVVDFSNKTIDFSALTYAGEHAFYKAFNSFGLYSDNSSIIFDFSSLETVKEYCFNLAFESVDIVGVDFSKVKTVNAYGFDHAFSSANFTSSPTSISFPALTTLGDSAFAGAFSNTGNKVNLHFPALTSNSFGAYTNQFNDMFNGCYRAQVHFPSNLQSIIGNWSSVQSGFGGTNTIVLFDLPATE